MIEPCHHKKHRRNEEGLLTHSEEELVRAQLGRGFQEGSSGRGNELDSGPVSFFLPLSLEILAL